MRAVFTQEVKILRFIWNPPSLHTVCGSQARLKTRWPHGWRDIQILLTYASNASSLAELRNVRSLQIAPRLPEDGAFDGGLTIRHEEIEMSTTLLTHDGHPLLVPDADVMSPVADSVADLRIDGFADRKRSARRLAS